MTALEPADQELVVHAVAPCDGPRAEMAYEQLGGVWQRCRDELGITQPVAGTNLPANLPDRAEVTSTGPFAAQEDRAADYQMIVRREHDVVVLSMVFATPLDTTRRHLRIGSTLPPGWYEFDRWWHRLAAGLTDSLLGVALVTQGTVPESAFADAALGDAVRAAVRPADADAPYWWCHGRRLDNGFAVWETSPADHRPERRLVVLAAAGRDRELSAWTWSDGSLALAPLGRYLLHATKVRYQSRVRGTGAQLDRLRRRADGRMDRVLAALAASDPRPDVQTEIHALRADEAELMLAATRVREMRTTVGIARRNMTASTAVPVADDKRLAERLGEQLASDAEYLDATLQRARHLRELTAGLSVGPPSPAASSPVLHDEPRMPGSGRLTAALEYRVLFGVDVVGYSARSSPGKVLVQRRLADLVRAVLTAMDVDERDTDRQDAGDGLHLVLPAKAQAHRALPTLLRQARKHLTADNRTNQDRIRLRLAVGVGPISSAALGFAGPTIIEVGRLLDSRVLKDAVTDHPDADLVVLVSDRLYGDVVGESYPGLHPDEFVQASVRVKEYDGTAWLWVGGRRTAGR